MKIAAKKTQYCLKLKNTLFHAILIFRVRYSQIRSSIALRSCNEYSTILLWKFPRPARRKSQMGIVPLRTYSFCIIAFIFEKCSIFYEQNITSLLLSFWKNNYFCLFRTILYYIIHLNVRIFHHLKQNTLWKFNSNLLEYLTKSALFLGKSACSNFFHLWGCHLFRYKCSFFLNSIRILLTTQEFWYKIEGKKCK